MITISALTFAYNKQKCLFENLDLNLESNRVYGLLGKNGTGKSTLLNLISGLLFPKSGTIKVMDKIPRKRQLGYLQDIFFVPEEFYLPEVSPQTYANMFGYFYPQFNFTQYFDYLSEFEIDPNHNLTKMSMGQQKKAFIAFALACNTRLLIMDEPTNGLDIPSKTQFRKLIASVSTESKCILISTHQVRDLENLIDTILILDNHQIVFNQPIDDISDRLSFTSYNSQEKPQNILYHEPGLFGAKAIAKNTDKNASRVDIELLFNAIITNKNKLTDIFTNGETPFK